jgi:hypothetical protein
MSYSYTDLNSSRGRLCRLCLAVFCLVAVCFSASAACVVRSNNGPDEIGDCVTDESMTFARSAVPTAGEASYGNWTDRYDMNHTIFAQTHSGKFSCGVIPCPMAGYSTDLYYPFIYTRYLSAPVTPSQVFRKTFNKEYHWVNVLKMNGNYVNLSDCSPDLLPYKGCTWAVGLFSTDVYDPASYGYLLTDNLKSIYPKAQGLAVDRGGAYMLLSGKNVQYNYRQGGYLGYCLPFRKFRTQRLKVAYKFYLVYVGDPANYKEYAEPQVVVHHRLVAHDTNNVVKPLEYTLSVHVVDNSTSRNIKNSTGDTVVSSYSMNDLGEYSFSAIRPLEKSFTSIVEFSTLRECGMTPAEENTVKDVYAILTATVQYPNYVIAIDTIRVQSAPRYVCASESSVKPGDIVHLTVHNDNSFLLHSFFRWEYSADKVNWKPDPLDAAGMKMLDDGTYKDKLEPQNLNSENVKELTSPTDVAALDLVIPKVTGDSLYIRAKYYPTFRGPAGCYRDFGKAANVIGNYFYLPPIVVNDPTKPKLTCNPLSAARAELFTEKGTCSVSLASLLDFLPSDNRPSLSVTPTKVEYWYSKSGSAQGAEMRLADESITFPAGSSYDLQTRLYYTDSEFHSCNQSFSVKDTTSPVIDCDTLKNIVAELKTNDCRLSVQSVQLPTPQSIDNCDAKIAGVLSPVPNSYPMGDTILTWHFADASGNTTTCPQTVTVKDKFAPVVDCDTLKNIVANLTTNDCRLSAQSVQLPTPQSIDNCDAKISGVLSPVPNSYPLGDTILTWHFTDASGNTTTCPQTVTVKDKFAPVIDCDTLKNIVAELTTNDCRLSANVVPLSVPQSIDNCDAKIAGVLSSVPTTYPLGDTILTWHFTDAAGNTTTCPQTVTVKDKFAPVIDCDTLKNIVANLTTNDCRLSANAVPLSVPQSIDNCGAKIAGVLSPIPTTYPMGDTVLTWHFTDASGNTTTCPQTVTVKDKFSPVIDCDTLKNIVAELTTNDCRLPSSAVPLSVPQSIDNCGAKISGVLSPVPTTYPMGDTVLTWHFTDVAGNTTTCAQTVTVKDKFSPVIDCDTLKNIVAELTNDCRLSASVVPLSVPQSIDNCGAKISGVLSPVPTSYPMGDTVLTWHFTDASGNTTTCPQTVTVKDKFSPVIDCDTLKNIVAELTNDCRLSASVVPLSVPQSIDNCGAKISGVLSPVPTSYPMGDTVLTWHFTDASGNTTTCPQTVTVKDKFSPVIDCDTLKNIVAELTTNDCRLSANVVPLSVPQSIDNCDSKITGVLSPVPTTYPLGDTILTWHFTDASGNTTTCPQTVTVKDKFAPVVDCDTLKNIVAELTTNDCRLSAQSVQLPIPQSVDNCDAKISGVLSPVPNSYPMGDTILTWHFTDASGNTTTCPQTVTVKDKFSPVIDCDTLKNIVANLTTNDCRLSAGAVPLSVPQSIDNCGAKIAGVLSSVPTTYPIGDTVLIWHFTDAAGNTTTCPQKVTVKDKFAPIVDCDTLKNIVAELTTNDCRLLANVVPLSVPQSIDNCDAKITGILSPVPTSYPMGDTVLIWHFTDVAGNTTTCAQTVTVKDRYVPVIDCDTLKNIVADLTTNECRLSSSVVPLSVPQSIDNCSAKIAGILSPVPTSYPLGDTILIWHFTDASGNTTTCPQTVTVKDKFAPIVDCDTLKNIVAELTTNDCRLSASAVSLSVPQSIDNCNLKIAGVLSPIPTTYPMGDTILTWHFTDAAGNTTTCAQTVTVKDEFAPVIDCDTLKNIVAELTTNDCRLPSSAVPLPVPQSIDNCDSKIAGVLSPVPTTYPLGDNILTWHFTDASGNTTTCPQTVTVKDKFAPIVDCDTLKNIVANLTTNDCRLSANAVPLSVPQSIDNCDAKIAGVLSSVPTTYPIGDTILTWHFTDVSGNATTCSQTVTVKDKFAPVVDCDTLKNIVANLTTNDCRLSASVLPLSVPQSIDNCGAKIAGVLSPVPTTYPMGDTVLTWHFTDASGNTTTCPQTVTVKDKFAPIVDCDTLKNIVAELTTNDCRLSASVVPLSIPQSIDNCDAKITGVLSPIPTTYPMGDTILTWHFTDVSGNTTTCPQKVTVKDKFSPVIDCDTLKNIVAELTTNDCRLSAQSVQLPIPQSVDNCDAKISGVLSPVPNSYPMGDTILTWHFTDASGNTTTCPQTVTVKDEFAPVIDCDTLKKCIFYEQSSNKVPFDSLKMITPIALDNCGQLVNGVVKDTDSYKVGASQVVWNFVDSAGNQSVCNQFIAIVDTFSDSLRCPTLFPMVVNLSDSVCQLSAQQVHLSVPKIAVDGKSIVGFLTEPPLYFSMDTTVIYWHFVSEEGQTSLCPQIVNVVDRHAPDFDCSALTGFVRYLGPENCTIAFDSLQLPISFAKDNCRTIAGIWHCEGNLDLSVGKTSLSLTFTDFNKNIKTCKSDVNVKDTIPPVWCPSCVDTVFVTSSTSPVLPVYGAMDNCSAVRISYTDSSTQSADPDDCSHHSYDLIRVFRATDAYGNVSVPRTCVCQVRDTAVPLLSMSAVPIEPVPIGHCQYLVPDLFRYISAHISDSSKLRVWQTPLAGDTLRQSCAVTFYAENRCGIRDSIVCPVLLPSRKQVVTIIAKSDTLCVDKSSPVSLVSTRLREAVGSSFLRNYDGQWMVVASTFVYDCYHDSVSANTLIYSNSPYTYGHLFQDAKGQPDIRLRNSLTTLNHACQSGRYVFVACDTTTRCTDTSAINLKLMERPRIVLAPDSLGEDTFRMSVCGVDTLAISHRLSQIDVCVDDMESEIIEEGWRHADLSLLGNLSPADSVPIVYYARNGCGVSTSVNSPYAVCDETALSGADSLRLAGNPHRLACWRIDSLYMNQSLMIEYHVPFSPSEVRLVADENVGQLKLCLMPDIQPSVVEWYRVSGIFDGNSGNRFDEKGRLHRVADMTDLDDERLLVDSSENGCILLSLPDTSASYYVVAGDGVCPAIPSELYNVDSQSLVIPTAITPYRHDGLNDIFMKGYPVMIFDQFGQKIFEGEDGWNGHNSVIGEMTVPGVYYYYLRLKDGSSRRGSIEVVKFIP